MIQQRRKIVIILTAIALFGGALFSSSAQPVKVVNSTSSTDDGSYKAELTPQTKIGNSELFFKMMFMVLLVAILAAAAVYVSKKVMPKFTKTGAKKIHVLESTHLGQRKSLHLIKIDNRLLLVGSTSDNMVKLCDINDVSDSASETEVEK